MNNVSLRNDVRIKEKIMWEHLEKHLSHKSLPKNVCWVSFKSTIAKF